MINNNASIKLPEKNCPICEINITESYPISSRCRSYLCPNCGYFSITFMAYKFTQIINDPVTKQKVSYFVRNHSDIDSLISIEQSEVSTIVENTKLPSVQEQINILLDWICSMSKSTLDTVDGNTKHLIALLGCLNQIQVIQVLDEVWNLGYIEMENPVAGPLRDRPLFNSFACHLTPTGIKRIQEIENEALQFEVKNIALEQLLKNNESTNLEVKGSCQLNINRLLNENRKYDLSKDLAKKGVLKTIVAFLNSSGGDIVIGALEKDKYIVKQISKIPFTEYENYYLIGVDIENDNLDEYELTLRNLIANHISKNIIGLIDISFPQINSYNLCRITVRQALDKWYYLDEAVFYVRDGNRTVPLKGNDADAYRKRNPR